MNGDEHWRRASYLLSALGAHTKIRFAQQLAPLGMAPQHFGVLRRLHDNEGSTQQEIADALRIRRSVMVGLLDELQTNGWVERRPHPADRRANALHLTAAGRRVLHRADRIADRLDAEVLAAIPAETRESFLAQLWRLGVATGISDGIYPTLPADLPGEFGAPHDPC